MKQLTAALGALAFACCAGAMAAEAPTVVGDWTDPTGSVIRILPCAQGICAQIVKLGAEAPTSVDENNPKASDRSRPLCGLVIGQGFHLLDDQHAEGGWLYDPRTGRTYHGSMERDGDALNLRGYVGMKLFGRTETWHPAKLDGQACVAQKV